MKKSKNFFGAGVLRILIPVAIISLGLFGCNKTEPGDAPVPGGGGTSQQVAAPTFDPAAGTYAEAQSIIISTTTDAASIRYTTDGTDPTSSAGTEYTAAISISETTTIKAIAYKNGMVDSAVAEAAYTINLTAVETPTFDPVGGTYTEATTVTISTATSDATIKYTTDGTDPITSGTAQTGTATVDVVIDYTDVVTIKAYAYKEGMADSAVATSTEYDVDTGAVANPVFSPPAGTYDSDQTVVISTTTADATIMYTTDGTDPTSTEGTEYAVPIPVSATTIIRAIAYDGTGVMADSIVVSATYTIVVADPVFDIAEGNYSTYQTVGISTTTADATIMYTTDGTDPTSTAGTPYTGPISVDVTTTIRAIAYDDTGVLGDSQIASATYVINLIPVETPTFDPVGGTYTEATTVTISTATSDATIKYTIDGTDPITSGTAQTGTATVDVVIDYTDVVTIKAYAYKTEMADSAVATDVYDVDTGAVANPVFSPGTGTYNNDQTVDITSTTVGATILYTTDGSTPTVPASGTEVTYTGSITVDATMTINAIAYDDTGVMGDSIVTSATYTIVVADPVFSPGTGTYNNDQTVTITSATTDPGVTILYTTDGSTPTVPASGTELTYSVPITVDATMIINAIAYDGVKDDSSVATANYVLEVAAPTFSPDGSTSAMAQTLAVTISTATTGATIVYTIDGSDPTGGGTTGTSVTDYIKDTTTIRAYATKAGYTDSTVADSVPYIITRVISGTYAEANLADFDIIIEVGNGDLASADGDYYDAAPGHIPGAIYLDRSESSPGILYQDTAGGNCVNGLVVSETDFNTYGNLIGLAPNDTSTTASKVLIYGDFTSGVALYWAARAFWVFDYYGVEVYWLDGGKDAWTQADTAGAGVGLDAGAPSFSSDTGYAASPELSKIAFETYIDLPYASGGAGRDDAIEANDRPNQVFFEARANAYGTHIPGAYLVDWTLNYDGSYLLQATMPAGFVDADVLTTTDNIAYCGSGTTASVNYLYLIYKGYPVRNYAGSMNEWVLCLGNTTITSSTPY